MPFRNSYQGLLLTDLDGTIKPSSGRPFSPADLEALRELGRQGWFRVVATGRSLFSFVLAWEPGLELDALIFSSGAGLCLWNAQGPGEILESHCFRPEEAAVALRAALELNRGFFAYLAPPDSHHFFYRRTADVPEGFDKRLESFSSQSKPWPGLERIAPSRLSQILIMAPGQEADRLEADFRRLAPGLSVLRSTSPFGDGCLWLEIFPPQVSKGQAAAALAARLGLGPERAAALGNDFNDRDLLQWAGRAFVTQDAPEELRRLYPAIPPAGHGGLALAAAQFAGAAK